MAVKLSEKMQERVKKVSEWLGLSLVETEIAMIEIGISYMEKGMQNGKKQSSKVQLPSESQPSVSERNRNSVSQSYQRG